MISYNKYTEKLDINANKIIKNNRKNNLYSNIKNNLELNSDLGKHKNKFNIPLSNKSSDDNQGDKKIFKKDLDNINEDINKVVNFEDSIQYLNLDQNIGKVESLNNINENLDFEGKLNYEEQK